MEVIYLMFYLISLKRKTMLLVKMFRENGSTQCILFIFIAIDSIFNSVKIVYGKKYLFKFYLIQETHQSFRKVNFLSKPQTETIQMVVIANWVRYYVSCYVYFVNALELGYLLEDLLMIQV